MGGRVVANSTVGDGASNRQDHVGDGRDDHGFPGNAGTCVVGDGIGSKCYGRVACHILNRIGIRWRIGYGYRIALCDAGGKCQGNRLGGGVH